jgi:rSAM/selenodomain-associated transferase 1
VAPAHVSHRGVCRGPSTERKSFGARQERAERLHRALLLRTLQTAAAVPGVQVRLVTTGSLRAARQLAGRAVPAPRLSVTLQAGSSAARRLETAVRHAFEDGAERVVVIGADSPELRRHHLEAALAALAGAPTGADGEPPASADRAVIGPALDGGYYLLGLSRFTRAPFEGMRFGSAEVHADTRVALHREGYTVEQLDRLHDVDDRRDLEALLARLRRQPTAADVRLMAEVLAVLADQAVDAMPAASVPPRAPASARLPARGPPAA